MGISDGKGRRPLSPAACNHRSYRNGRPRAKTKAVPSVPSSWAQAHISGPRSCIQILKLMGTPGTLGTSFGLNRLQCSHSFPEVGTLGTAKECEPIVHNIETTDDNESFYSVD